MTTAPTHPRDRATSEPDPIGPVSDRPGVSTPPPPDAPDQIGAWLDRLLRLTRLPQRESEELRDELDAHLRERVRDLMLGGHDEPEAIHKSISELGDLALLAQRYRDASRSPKRRVIMHTALIAATTAALGLSTVALQQSQPEGLPAGGQRLSLAPDAGTADLAPESLSGLGGLPVLNNAFLRPTISSAPIQQDIDEDTLSEVLTMLAESQDLRPYVHWRDLDAEAEFVLADLPLAGQRLDRAFEMINDALDLIGEQVLAYRADEGLLEIASQGYFDRRERELVTYDVSELVYAGGPLEISSEGEVLVELIVEMVESEAWPQYGGDIASIYTVGGKLFVNAPPRIHERVEWLLAQLSADEEHAARDRALENFALAALQTVDPMASRVAPAGYVVDSPAQIRLRAADGRVFAEFRDGECLTRLEAQEIELSADSVAVLQLHDPAEAIDADPGITEGD